MILEIFAFILGGIVGSFLNVCILRIPAEESIVFPGSRCPRCKKSIRFYDNIPLVSYFVLGGKCRYCHGPISLQYPLVEGVTALSSLLLFIRFGPSFNYLVYFAFMAALITVTVIDLYHQIIPNVITFPGIGVGLMVSLLLAPIPFWDSLFGVLLGGGSLFLVATVYQWLFKREGMGFGDVKLLAMIGAFLGWKSVILTILLSSLVGSLAGIILILIKGKDFKYAIPYGPFLSLGAAISLFYGGRMIAWYLFFNR